MRTFPLEDIAQGTATYPDLRGKTALVTGAERGVGQGIATVLAQQGMKVMIAGVSAEEGRVAERQFQEAGKDVQFLAADLSETAAVDVCLEAVYRQCDSLDLLVNNAARNQLLEFVDYEDDTHHEIFEKNLRVVMNVTRRVVSRMVADRTRGSIVSISSVGAQRAHRQSVAYNASKGAVEAMTRAIALDVAPHGIRVNAVSPGAIVNRPIDAATASFRQTQQAGIPLGRVGTVTDVGNMVAFLASESASYVTGQVFVVDGGLSAQLTPPGTYI